MYSTTTGAAEQNLGFITPIILGERVRESAKQTKFWKNGIAVLCLGIPKFTRKMYIPSGLALHTAAFFTSKVRGQETRRKVMNPITQFATVVNRME